MMRFLLGAVIAAGLVLGMSSGARAQADDIVGVISSQIEAFQANDLDKAFSFASPMIKGIFGNPERFGQMVRNGYPMVWRPAAVDYGEMRTVAGKTVQTVFFTDQAGRVYEASYEMLETDAGWQINGVSLQEAGLGA